MPPGRSTRAEVEEDDQEVCLHQDMEEVVEEMDMEDQELLTDTEMITEMIIGEEEVVIEEVLHHQGEVEVVEMTDIEVILEVTEEVA